MKVTIAPDFRDLLPELTPEEFEQLKENNLADPDHERIPPVVVWQCGKNWIVVDGHHTLKARQNMRINGKAVKIRYVKMEFTSRADAKTYARRAQLGRRNLSPSQVAMLLAHEPKVPEGANLHPSTKPEENDDCPPSREELARQHNISERTLKHADKVNGQGAAAVKKAVTAGEVSVSDAASIADRPKKEQAEAVKKVKERKARTLKEAASGNGAPKKQKQFDRSYWFKQWEQAIGPVVRLVDKIAEGVRERHDPHHEAIQEKLNDATEELMEWMGVKK
jgi:hypothetical protein